MKLKPKQSDEEESLKPSVPHPDFNFPFPDNSVPSFLPRLPRQKENEHEKEQIVEHVTSSRNIYILNENCGERTMFHPKEKVTIKCERL